MLHDHGHFPDKRQLAGCSHDSLHPSVRLN